MDKLDIPLLPAVKAPPYYNNFSIAFLISAVPSAFPNRATGAPVLSNRKRASKFHCARFQTSTRRKAIAGIHINKSVLKTKQKEDQDKGNDANHATHLCTERTCGFFGVF
jgi:hypothetical protein